MLTVLILSRNKKHLLCTQTILKLSLHNGFLGEGVENVVHGVRDVYRLVSAQQVRAVALLVHVDYAQRSRKTFVLSLTCGDSRN